MQDATTDVDTDVRTDANVGADADRPDRQRDRWLLVALVAVALAVRLLFLFVLTDTDVVYSDAEQYHEIAGHLADGRGFWGTFPQLEPHPTAFRPPGYPSLLAVPYALFGQSVVVGKLFNVAIGIGVVLLAVAVARRIGGPKAGWVAGALVAIYPPLVHNDVNLLTEPLSLALLLGAVLLLLDERAGWAGIVVGALVLTRPSAQFLIPAAAVWIWWRLGLRRALRFTAIAVLVVVPWIVRNAVQVDAVALVTSNGFNLAAIYSTPAQANGQFTNPIFDDEFESTRLTQFDEAAWDRQLRELGMAGLRENPSYVLRHIGHNSMGYFELDPERNRSAEWFDGRNQTVRTGALPLFYTVTVLGAIGLWTHRRHPGAQLVAGAALYFTVGSLLLVSPPRLRAPFDLACCIGAGLLVADMWRRRRAGGRPEATPDASTRSVVAG